MMKRFPFQFVFFLASLLGLLLCLVALPARAQTISIPDLEQVRLGEADLPPGFRAVRGARVESKLSFFTTLWEPYLDADTQARLQNLAAFQTGQTGEEQLLINALIAPLSAVEVEKVSQAFAAPGFLADEMAAMTGEQVLFQAGQAENVVRFNSWCFCGSNVYQAEYVAVRRANVLEITAVFYPAGSQVRVGAFRVARRLDHRVGIVVAAAEAPFRVSDSLIPDFTTYVPTPQEISLQPEVLYANLVLTAVTMIVFALATKAFSLYLEEKKVEEVVAPLRWLGDLQKTIDGFFEKHGKEKLYGLLRLGLTLFFYGLVFSLLEEDWHPFSWRGVFVFLSFVLAFGVVGLVDDLRQHYVIKRMPEHVAAELRVRPANFLLSLASVGLSWGLKLKPGLMFGSPEALELDREKLPAARRDELTRISLWTLVLMGGICWGATFVTSWLQGSLLRRSGVDLVAAIEAVLLIITVVALENLFIQMLGFRGSFGEALLKKAWWQWLLGMIPTSFAFYHILINPRGELADAIREPNVQVSLWAAVVFALMTLLLWISAIIKKPRLWSKWNRLQVGATVVLLLVLVTVGLVFSPKPASLSSAPPPIPIYPTEAPPPGVLLQGMIVQETPEPASPQESLWKLVWQEDFHSGAPGWPIGEQEDEWSLQERKLEYGIYRIKAMGRVGELVLPTLPGGLPVVQDFYLALDLRQISGPAEAEVGLIFRYQEPGTFYYLGISAQSRLWIQRYEQGEWTTLVEALDVLGFAPCSWNRVAVLGQGPNFQIFVNGSPVAEFSDEALPTGSIALGVWFARSGEMGIFEFDNLELREP